MAAAIVGRQPHDVRPDRRRLDLRVVLGEKPDDLAAARGVVQLSGSLDHQFSDRAVIWVRHMLVLSRPLAQVGSSGLRCDGARSRAGVSDGPPARCRRARRTAGEGASTGLAGRWRPPIVPVRDARFRTDRALMPVATGVG